MRHQRLFRAVRPRISHRPHVAAAGSFNVNKRVSVCTYRIDLAETPLSAIPMHTKRSPHDPFSIETNRMGIISAYSSYTE
jgi:hypothetical protein